MNDESRFYIGEYKSEHTHGGMPKERALSFRDPETAQKMGELVWAFDKGEEDAKFLLLTFARYFMVEDWITYVSALNKIRDNKLPGITNPNSYIQQKEDTLTVSKEEFLKAFAVVGEFFADLKCGGTTAPADVPEPKKTTKKKPKEEPKPDTVDEDIDIALEDELELPTKTVEELKVDARAVSQKLAKKIGDTDLSRAAVFASLKKAGGEGAKNLASLDTAEKLAAYIADVEGKLK